MTEDDAAMSSDGLVVGEEPAARDGLYPSVGKKSDETKNPCTFSGSSFPTRFAVHHSKAARRSNTSDCFLMSR